MMNWSEKTSVQAARAKASSIRAVVGKAMRHADMVFFAGGEPSPDLFAYKEIRAAYDKVLGDRQLAAAALQYSGSEGIPALRDWVVQRMADAGVSCTRDNVLITSGSQQGLDLVGRLFVDLATPVYVQTPTYSGALQAFNAHGASFRTLPAAVTSEVRPQRRGLVYVIADAQNPSGETLTLEQRKETIRLADRLELPIVEDDAYRGLQFEGSRLPSLMSLALDGKEVDQGSVIHLGTFSKTIVPGLRVGWVVAPAPLIERLTAIKQGADLQTSALAQMVALELVGLTTGETVRKLSDAYKSKRDAMLAALHTEFGSEVEWTQPQGGFFVWMTLPEGSDATAELDGAIAAGVVYVPGQSFHADGSGKNTLRLSFSMMSEDRIREGVKRLGNALRPAIARATHAVAGAER